MFKEYQDKINQTLYEGDDSKLANIARELLVKLECATNALTAISEGEEPHEVVVDIALKSIFE